MAVEDGVDFFRGGEVGDGDRVVADLRDADGAALRGNAVDGVPGVGFARRGMRVEPRVQALAGDFADEDHGIGNRPIGPAGVGHAVQGDGHLVEVALGVDADGVNELLVLGGVLGRLRALCGGRRGWAGDRCR